MDHTQHITINLTDNTPSDDDLKLPYKDTKRDFLRQQYNYDTHIVFKYDCFPSSNNFLSTILTGYAKHLPVHLTPEDFLLNLDCIVSEFVQTDPEKYRPLFVSHTEKEIIQFHAEHEKNGTEWDKALSHWAKTIVDKSTDGDFTKTFLCDFSSSTVVDYLISCSHLMNINKNYYGYEMIYCCGIPKVYLHGSTEDWQNLVKKTISIMDKFQNTELYQYIKKMYLPPLVQLHNTVSQYVDEYWWSNMIKSSKCGSGSQDEFSGWICDMFPVIRRPDKYHKTFSQSMLMTNVISGKSQTLIHVDDNGHRYDVELNAGFMGVHQSEDGSLHTLRGYYVKKI